MATVSENVATTIQNDSEGTMNLKDKLVYLK